MMLTDSEVEELNTSLSNSSGKKEEIFSDEENEFFSVFEEYFLDDGSEETFSSLTENSSDDEKDCVQLSDSIWMFPDRRISTHGEIYHGELRSGILATRPIVLKLVENTPQSITEARILAKLNHHSHVLSLIHTGTCNFKLVDQIYIALDICHHENLLEFVTNRKDQGFAFNLSQAIEIAEQMVDGLKYIHFNRIIHKDLKPDNILFSFDQILIKIADFGVSQEIESSSTELFEEGQFGTNGFRPPESFGRGIISQKSDIFSLGVTSYFVLSDGEHAFGEDSDGWNYHMKSGIIDLSGLLVPNIKTTEHLIKSMIENKINHRPTIGQVSEHPFWTGNEVPCDFDYHCPESSSSLIPPTPEEPSHNIGDMSLFLEHIKKIELRDEAAAAKRRHRDKNYGEYLASSGTKRDLTAEVGKVQVKLSTEEAYRVHMTNLADVRKNLQGYGVRVQRFTRDFRFGKEREAAFHKGDGGNFHFEHSPITITATSDENISTPGGTEEKNATPGSSTPKTSTKIADVRKILQGYGARIQRFTRDFRFGREVEGKFNDQNVTIMQFNEDDVEKYENAVDVLTNLEHENIVHFIKEIPENCVIITEFCEYGTLKEYLAGDGKRVELSDLFRMGAQIALGMDFLHRKKYVHCDLRAGNVAVTTNLICKISGFGMSRHVGLRGGSSVDENAILTRWAAQEVIQKGCVSFKSDVWSFGVVLWEIATRGDKPYPGNTRYLKESICFGHRMLKPKQCPSGLYFNIMMPCWNEDPDARPTFECLEKSLLSYDVEAEQKEESVTVRALMDNTADEKGELSFKKGDIIVDCTTSSYGLGWRLGTLDGKTAHFSTNRVVQVKTHEA